MEVKPQRKLIPKAWILAMKQDKKCFTCGIHIKQYQNVKFDGPTAHDKAFWIRYVDHATDFDKQVAVCHQCLQDINNRKPQKPQPYVDKEVRRQQLIDSANEIMSSYGMPQQARLKVGNRLIGAGRISAHMDDELKKANR